MKINQIISEKSKSKSQAKTMTAACKNAKFRKKVDIPKKVACDFHDEDKGTFHEDVSTLQIDQKTDLDLKDEQGNQVDTNPNEKTTGTLVFNRVTKKYDTLMPGEKMSNDHQDVSKEDPNKLKRELEVQKRNDEKARKEAERQAKSAQSVSKPQGTTGTQGPV